MERVLVLTGFLVVVAAQNSTVVKRGGVEIFPDFAIVHAYIDVHEFETEVTNACDEVTKYYNIVNQPSEFCHHEEDENGTLTYRDDDVTCRCIQRDIDVMKIIALQGFQHLKNRCHLALSLNEQVFTSVEASEGAFQESKLDRKKRSTKTKSRSKAKLFGEGFSHFEQFQKVVDKAMPIVLEKFADGGEGDWYNVAEMLDTILFPETGVTMSQFNAAVETLQAETTDNWCMIVINSKITDLSNKVSSSIERAIYLSKAWIDPSVRWVTPNHFSKPTVKNMVQHINERVTDDGLEVQLEEEEIYEKGAIPIIRTVSGKKLQGHLFFKLVSKLADGRVGEKITSLDRALVSLKGESWKLSNEFVGTQLGGLVATFVMGVITYILNYHRLLRIQGQGRLQNPPDEEALVEHPQVNVAGSNNEVVDEMEMENIPTGRRFQSTA